MYGVLYEYQNANLLLLTCLLQRVKSLDCTADEVRVCLMQNAGSLQQHSQRARRGLLSHHPVSSLQSRGWSDSSRSALYTRPSVSYGTMADGHRGVLGPRITPRSRGVK